MTPLEWVGFPAYLLAPLGFIFFGNGDLRRKDETYLAKLQSHFFIPGIWGLIFSWTVLGLLMGVAGFLFWKDSAAAALYDPTLALFWANLALLMAWFRLIKMGHPTAAFIVNLVGVFGTALAAAILMAVSGSFAAFGCYIIYVISIFITMIWSGRVAMNGAVPSIKLKVGVDMDIEKAPLIPASAPSAKEAEKPANVNSQFQASSSSRAPINSAVLRVPSK